MHMYKYMYMYMYVYMYIAREKERERERERQNDRNTFQILKASFELRNLNLWKLPDLVPRARARLPAPSTRRAQCARDGLGSSGEG